MFLRLLMIADDLTGACDAAACLAKLDQRVKVLAGTEEITPISNEAGEINVYNTQTRTLNIAEAYSKVQKLAEAMDRHYYYERSPYCVVKKIDSAFRGSVGAEIEALLDGGKRTTAFLINAIPSMNRITLKGMQWFGNEKIADSGFAKDPLNPVTESYIPDIIQKTSKIEVQCIDIEQVMSGQFAQIIKNHDLGKKKYLYSMQLSKMIFVPS